MSVTGAISKLAIIIFPCQKHGLQAKGEGECHQPKVQSLIPMSDSLRVNLGGCPGLESLSSLLTRLKPGQWGPALAACLTKEPAVAPTHTTMTSQIKWTFRVDSLQQWKSLGKHKVSRKSEGQAKVRLPTPKANTYYDAAN